MSRDYDIMVFGATGFTGGMTAEYLARHAPPGVRLAIAGRSRTKLEAVKSRLNRAVGIVEASVTEPTSLSRMAAQTRVLLTTVGPFIDYGEPVVRACVQERTDYIDSTGEPRFVQGLLARYAAQAAERGVRIVPSCGFDSIPADLGALFTVKQLPRDQPIRLSGHVSLQGVFSGGTERSAIKAMAPSNDPSAKAALPAATPAGRRVQLMKSKVQHRPGLGWMTPMPTIDPQVVLRSASALDHYGPDFSYAHYAVHASFFHLLGAIWLFGSLAFFARFAPTRALLLNAVKKSGEGPSQEQMQKAWFKVRFIAECAGQILQTEVSGGDPGYGETSKMLAESALCLAEDAALLPAQAGVLTTAQAMGDVLIARLERAGLRFAVLG